VTAPGDRAALSPISLEGDSYDREGSHHPDAMSAVIRAAMNHLTNARVVDDTAALRA
jgi:uncharacterized protein (DUF362 family)